jgi:hypothetical protein
MRKFARRLITLETNEKKSSGAKDSAAFPVPEKLRPTLSMLVGNAGFQTLLTRALTLATEEVPWLRAVMVSADGTLVGWEEPYAQLGPDKFSEGRVVLVAQLLGLLEAFIGENLTVRLVREIWPKLSLGDMNLDQGEKNEKTSKAG